jgi:sugar phosphate isomerase/epimerase
MSEEATIERRGRISRRAALAAAAAFAAGGARATARPAPAPLPVGLQLYSINQSLDADFDGALKTVARIGYKYVELAGLHGRSPEQVRAAFDGFGLKCPSAHFPPDDWVKGSARPIEIAKAVGASTVVCPMPPIPERLKGRASTGAQTGLAAAYDGMTLADWKAFAAFLNRLGGDARAAGLAFAYHNHNIDFRDLGGGRTPIDIVLTETDPRLVDLEVDLGWVKAAGHDPAAFLERHANRIILVHLKDLKPTPPNFGFQMAPTEMGSGVIDWTRVLAAVRKTRARYGFVEQEPPYAIPQLQSAKISFDYLARLQG